MNLKKYLQQQAEKDAYSLLTEADELFIDQLVKNYHVGEKKEKPKRRWWWKRNKQKK